MQRKLTSTQNPPFTWQNQEHLFITLLVQTRHLKLKEAALFSTLSKAWRSAFQGALFWENKYNIHFPTRPLSLTRGAKLNWKAAFDTAYERESDEYYRLAVRSRSRALEQSIHSSHHKPNWHHEYKTQVVSLLPQNPIKKRLDLIFAIREDDEEAVIAITRSFLAAPISDSISFAKNYSYPFFRDAIQKAREYNRQKILNYFYEIVKSGDNPAFILLGEASEVKFKFYEKTVALAIQCRQPISEVEQQIAKVTAMQEIDLKIFGKKSDLLFSPGLLHCAVQDDNSETVTALLDASPNLVNAEEKDHPRTITALLLAAEKGYTDLVTLLLQRGALVNQKCEGSPAYPLLAACEAGHADIVAHLIHADADLRVYNYYGYAIHIAVRKGHLPIIQQLLRADPSLLELPDQNGNTALSLALSLGYYHQNWPLVNFLIQAHTEPEEKTDSPKTLNPETQKLIFLTQAQTGDLSRIQEQLNKEPSLLNQSDKHGRTALDLAASAGHFTVVQELLRRGATISPNTLCLAAEKGHEKVVKYLLQYPELDPRQAIHSAARHGQLSIVKILAAKNPRLLHTSDEQANTVLHQAVMENHLPLVKMIVEQDALSLNQKNLHGFSPLLLAADYAEHNFSTEKFQLVNYLLDQPGLDFEVAWPEYKPTRFDLENPSFLELSKTTAAPNAGDTLLHWAIKRGYQELALRLIEKGAALTTRGGQNSSHPIHLAVYYQNFGILKELISKNPYCIKEIDGAEKNCFHYVTPESADKIAAILIQTKNLPPSFWIHHFPRQMLSPRFQNRLDLLKYEAERGIAPRYKKSFKFFRCVFNFGFSREQKLAGVEAIKKCFLYGEPSQVSAQQMRVIQKGELGKIYQKLRQTR